MKKISLAIFSLLAIIFLGAGCMNYNQAPQAPTPQTGTPVINSNTEYFPPTNVNAATPSANVNVEIPSGTNAPPPSAAVNQPVPAPTQATVTVDIKNFTFSPAEITINAGTTVEWQNYDSVSHQIAGTGFGSGALTQGGTYSFTFTQAGIYDYHCAIHPSMTGKIIVR